ncbi:MAG: class I SAM-dependent methyltransferase [Pseudomonadota bacterium]
MTPEEYNAWYDSPRGRWMGDVEFELLCRHLDMTPGKSLLDVGCGTGWFTRRFAAAGLDVTGLDIDADALDFACERSHDIAYVEGNACRLPFPDHSFDQVISITALCFVDDWPRAIAEIVRVTRRRFVLGLLNRHSLLWLDKGRNGGKGAYHGAHWHTGRELDEAMQKLPVEPIHFSSAIFLPSGTDFAQAMERTLPKSLPWGALLLVSGNV